jgi:hypothetical protein
MFLFQEKLGFQADLVLPENPVVRVDLVVQVQE